MNFIEEYFILDLTLCDELIKYHKNNNFKYIGKIQSKEGPVVDITEKDSTDVSFELRTNPTNNLFEYAEIQTRFSKVLQESVDQYINKYKYCNNFASFGISEGVFIQHYLPKQGYHKWHCERTSARMPATTRHLVFMLYLNDVNDGGETEFYYQKVKIKPVKGKMLIWTADWTHTHRGIPSPTEEKYIITGWFNYLN